MAVARASDLHGYFFVAFEGHWSEKIAHDASAGEMASALAGIPTLGDVEVRRRYARPTDTSLSMHESTYHVIVEQHGFMPGDNVCLGLCSLKHLEWRDRPLVVLFTLRLLPKMKVTREGWSLSLRSPRHPGDLPPLLATRKYLVGFYEQSHVERSDPGLRGRTGCSRHVLAGNLRSQPR